jgi:MFS family permease
LSGTTAGARDIRQLVAGGRMSAHQLAAIAVCVGLNMLDGFDVLVMSFTASGVSAEWKLTGSQLGLLFSAGLLGMAAGSMFLAPRADRFGRRNIVMASVLIVSFGMLFSGFSRSYVQLGILRAATGVGIGGILANATVLVAEYSSDRWRSTASYLYTSGYSIGATLGGAVAAILIARFGWRAAFEFGHHAASDVLGIARVAGISDHTPASAILAQAQSAIDEDASGDNYSAAAARGRPPGAQYCFYPAFIESSACTVDGSIMDRILFYHGRLLLRFQLDAQATSFRRSDCPTGNQ